MYEQHKKSFMRSFNQKKTWRGVSKIDTCWDAKHKIIYLIYFFFLFILFFNVDNYPSTAYNKNSNKMLIDVNTLVRKPIGHETFYMKKKVK